MNEYVLKYQPSAEMLNRAMVVWAKPERSRREKSVRIAFGVVCYVALIAGALVLLRYDLVTNQMLAGVGLGMFAGVGFLVAMHQRSMKKIKKFTHDAMSRHGVTDAVFRAEGVEMTSQISTSQMDWLCFDEIMPLTDATVLRTGAALYAVPDVALPSGVTPEQFRSDLQNWQEAAR